MKEMGLPNRQRQDRKTSYGNSAYSKQDVKGEEKGEEAREIPGQEARNVDSDSSRQGGFLAFECTSPLALCTACQLRSVKPSKGPLDPRKCGANWGRGVAQPLWTSKRYMYHTMPDGSAWPSFGEPFPNGGGRRPSRLAGCLRLPSVAISNCTSVS